MSRNDVIAKFKDEGLLFVSSGLLVKAMKVDFDFSLTYTRDGMKSIMCGRKGDYLIKLEGDWIVINEETFDVLFTVLGTQNLLILGEDNDHIQ